MPSFKKTQLLAALWGILIVVLVTPTASAAEGKGTKVVRSANDTIRSLLKKQVKPGSAEETKLSKEVTKSVQSFLDIDELGRRAMSDHWKGLSEKERAHFLELLRSLIEANYVAGLRANLDYEVKYLGEEVKRNGKILVNTEIVAKRRGRPYTIAVSYQLRDDNGNLRAFDVVTDGVGLVENYRAQFNKLIEKKGFAELIRLMEKKLAKMQSA